MNEREYREGFGGWLPVPGYEEFYEASDAGQVRSLRTGRVMSLGTDKDGYPVVSFYGPNGRKAICLHRLIAEMFVPGRSVLHRQVAHLDGTRTNARADNLKWVSKVENHFHMRAHGTHPGGENHPQAKLSAEDVKQIRAATGGRIGAALGRRFGVDRSTISQIRRGLIWKPGQSRIPCAGELQ